MRMYQLHKHCHPEWDRSTYDGSSCGGSYLDDVEDIMDFVFESNIQANIANIEDYSSDHSGDGEDDEDD